MPTRQVRVWAVHPWPHDGYTVYEIRTTGPVLTTTNAFAASLCQRAVDLSQPVRLTWDDTFRDHLRLEHVELEQTA